MCYISKNEKSKINIPGVVKRGESYRITVSHGYDTNGKQVRATQTWKPSQGMTQTDIKNALLREKMRLEDDLMSGQSAFDKKITFEQFTSIWMRDYGNTHLKAKTLRNYCDNLDRINVVIGHIPLVQLQPIHLNAFYANLSEEGIKSNARYASTDNRLRNYLKTRKITQENLSVTSGVSIGTVRSAVKGNAITAKSKDAIVNALGVKSSDQIFTKISDDIGLSSASIVYHHHVISTILAKAVDWGYISDNPADRASPPKAEYAEAECPDSETCRNILTVVEAEKIVYKTLVVLIMFTGMRRGEALGLMWSDVDFDNGTIDICKERIYVRGVGIKVDSPKNKTSNRIISVSTAALDVLRLYKDYLTATAHGKEFKDDCFIFVNDKCDPLHPDTPAKWFSRFLQKNDLPAIHLHSLRHANATLLLENGVDIKTVSKRLGHANTQTTGLIYSHALRKADAIAADKLDDLLCPSVTAASDES